MQSLSPDDPWSGDSSIDPDAIMRRVRAEIARRHAADVGVAHPVHGSAMELKGSGARWHPAAPRLPDKDQYVLADFLGFDDEDFVEVAYSKLLRRPANDAGSREYLDALRNGVIGKVEVLGLIRFSEEGRRSAVHVDGLLLPYKLHQWRRKRVVGWFIGMAMAIARLPRMASHLQRLEATAARESHAIGHLLNFRLEGVQTSLSRLIEAVDHQDSALGRLANEQQRGIEEHDARLAALRDRADAHDAALATSKARLDGLDAALVARKALIDAHGAALAGLQAGVERQNASFAELRGHVLDEQRRLRIMMDRLAVFLDTMTTKGHQGNQGYAHPPERQYVAFEDAFRGERGEIKKRAEHYLKTLTAAGIQSNGGEVILDLGCGRGEWLEVLAENGYRGRGVDLDEGMLAASSEMKLDVVKASALDYLRVQDGGSFAAITAMHLVEHIAHSALIELLDEVLRVLRPGGVLILETPNPENVLVGSCMFYMDPTHLHPIPPLLLQWVVQARGFEQVAIERLSDHRGEPALTPVPGSVPGAAQINQMVAWFTAPPDYAVIASKPMLANNT